LAAVTSAWPLAARAKEPGRTFRIGMAEPVSAELNAAYLAAFRQELKRLGYVEGRNLVIEHRSADGDAAGSRRYSPN
jgi:putative ABC transport system substrate-binding protein